MLDRLERVGLLLTRGLSVLGLAALMVLACLTLADGLLRWLANRPIEGVRDLGASRSRSPSPAAFRSA